MHNVENMLAAICVAHRLQIPDEKIKDAIRAYRGVRRRFEYVVAPGEHPQGMVCVDDYAHHPEELRALVRGARDLFPDKKCTIVFQPHLFSRTRDFASEFAAVLDEADEVVLLPVYPARELPMEGVDSSLIGSKMKRNKALLLEKDMLAGWVTGNRVELLLLAGAGDIDTLVKEVRNSILEKKL
jgi:UDP-N-acetylmuramate--alanine ligase